MLRFAAPNIDPRTDPACARELLHIAARDHAYAQRHHARAVAERSTCAQRFGHLRRIALLAEANATDARIEAHA